MLIVQKYGGSSVADAARIRHVAGRILASRRAGHRVVAVVSAMGDTTDDLIELARQVHSRPADREMDMLLATGEQAACALLAMALHARGAAAIAMTGPQAGIFVDNAHTRAKIQAVRPERIQRHLQHGEIVIVAGFQGLNKRNDIATLGRGGSDTTAVALAAALKADRCQLFKDVEGVYTADPRVVRSARKLNEIAYDEMLELASLGADVLQARAVEFAKNHKVVLEVRSSFNRHPGTIVREEVHTMEDIVVRGVTADQKQAKLTVQGVPDRPGVAAKVFKRLAAAQVNVDMIVQNVSAQGQTDISFTVPRDELLRAQEALEKHERALRSCRIAVDRDIAKVSLVGVGMRSHSGVAHRMFAALAAQRINIEMISTSEIKISVVIRRKQSDAAVRALHRAFGLGRTKRSK